MNPKQSNRRRFLKEGAALAGLAVGAMRSASGQTRGPEAPQARPKDLKTYGERSRFVTSLRWQQPGFASSILTPLQDSIGIITPSALHYVRSHESPTPDLDPRQHRLLIHGMVDHPVIFTLEELKRLPSVTRVYFVECNGNSSPTIAASLEGSRRFMPDATVQQIHGATSCSEWTGVLLSLLLQGAGVQKGASWIIAEGAEPARHWVSIPLAKAMEDVLIAYGQNGEPVRPDNGFPLRLLAPGFVGNRNVKWLRRLKLVDQPYMSHVEGRGALRGDGKARWYESDLGPKSLITFPSGGQRLPGRGFYEINGLAWSGGGVVRRVEVSTDGGRSWKDAQLQDPVLRIAHTRFRFPWTWDGEETVLQSRCMDELGQVQPTLAEFAGVWGVSPDYFRSSSPVNRFNGIQPWKVTREGSVYNATF